MKSFTSWLAAFALALWLPPKITEVRFLLRALASLSVILTLLTPREGYSASFSLSSIAPFSDYVTSPVPFSRSTPGNAVESICDTCLLTYDAQADSSLSFTSLHSHISFYVSAEGPFSIQNGPNGFTALSMSDQIVPTGGSGPGTLQVTLSIRGTGVTNSPIFSYGGGYGGGGSFAGTGTITVPFTFGSPVGIGFGLYAGVGTFGFGSPASHIGGVADYSATLGAFRVFDQNLQPVPGALVQSTTGFQYPVTIGAPTVADILRNSVVAVTSGPGISAAFVPNEVDLATAKQILGVHHLNWVQHVVEAPQQLTFEVLNRRGEVVSSAATPLVDPILSDSLSPDAPFSYGIDSQSAHNRLVVSVVPPADNSEPYYNENDGEWASHNHNSTSTVTFGDSPALPISFFAPGEFVKFETELVGVKLNGDVVHFPAGLGTRFTWKTNSVGVFDLAYLKNDGPLPSPVISGGVFDVQLDAGDYNDDGVVDAADYVVWRKNDGTPDGYNTWRANFGNTLSGNSGSSVNTTEALATVPEPATSCLLLLGVVVFAASRHRFNCDPRSVRRR